MRRGVLLLASVSAFSLAAPAARSQAIVFDPAAFGQLVQQVQQMLQQIQLLQQQLQQLMAVYNAISHVTDLASAVGVLSTLGIQNPLPINVGSVQSLLNGSGNTAGTLGSIGTLFNANFGSSHVYTPTGNSFNVTLMQSNANSIAGVQALSGQLYQSMSDRLQTMTQLQDRIANSQDTKDIGDLSARLQAEQSYIQSQQSQAQTLALMQVAAYQSQQQQREEERQQDIDTVMAANPNQ